MADLANTQTKLPVAALGTREHVLKVKASVVVTAGNDTTSDGTVTFDTPFVDIPEVVGVSCVDSAVIKGNIGCHTVSKTGLTAFIYQVLTADVASGTYEIEVTLVGWKAS